MTTSPSSMGELELPPDWQSGLPNELLAAVEDFVIVSDSVLGTERVDAIQFLLNLLLDADTPGEIEAFVRKHEGSDFILETDPEGNLRPLTQSTGTKPPTQVVIPNELFRILVKEVMTFPNDDERLVRETSLREAMGEATGWLVDPEKLFGHLVLVHGADPVALERDFDALLELHSGFHRSQPAVPI